MTIIFQKNMALQLYISYIPKDVDSDKIIEKVAELLKGLNVEFPIKWELIQTRRILIKKFKSS